MSTPRIQRRVVLETADTADWAELHPILRRVYAARGLRDATEARLPISAMQSPNGLNDLARACALLQTAIDRQQRILVIGDFDCDGATGAALAVRGLRLLGATQVEFDVPHRQQHGYGLSPALVADLPRPLPELLVTVDSGIACVDGVAAAKAEGCTVLVTDHHLPGERLPDADAIVNPQLLGGDHSDGHAQELKQLAGVGVMFYLLLALRARLREAGRFDAARQPDLSSLLDLLAVGTVADMVPLGRNNRILVAAGLRRIRAGRCQPGVAALAQVAGRDVSKLDAADIGFAIGPRLNAAGRLEDMRLGIACLLCDDADVAFGMAQELDRINRERRDLQAEMLEQAEAALNGLEHRIDGEAALVLGEADWHPGVVGLVASKLKERWHRPSIALAPAGEGSTQWRGSARSVPGFHIRDALAEVARRSPDLLPRYGGHAMAAGLSIEGDRIDELRSLFRTVADEWLSPEQRHAVLLSDGELSASDFNRDLAEHLRDGGPWGQAFPEPLFDGEFEVTGWRIVGERHLKLELDLNGQRLSAIQFGGWHGEAPPSRLRIAYRLAPDDWRGGDAIQLIVLHREAVTPTAPQKR